MFAFVKAELEKLNIDLVSCLSLKECKILRPYLLEKHEINSGSVIIFAVPYLTKTSAGDRNISSYAVSRDYHLFFADLFKSLIENLKKEYPNNKFAGFTDHSPIDEIHAAAKAGLGVIGKNHLLITKKYSSYIFLGEIITDAILPSLATEVGTCINCGKCMDFCPANIYNVECISAITQKKGELSSREAEIIKSTNCAWGCDKCQEVCPHTKKAINNETIYSKSEFFNQNLTPSPTSEDIENMSKEDFSARAYSWRGKNTIKRNLAIIEGREI
jgi:epoxyqueuosine reductase